MTVAEIKEYVKKAIKATNLNKYVYNNKGEIIGETYTGEIIEKLVVILSMLDELETPKAKWLYSADEDEAPYYRCSNCGIISSDGTEDICENCGEIMEVEE